MLQNCWDIRRCGRQEHGEKTDELGTCPASPKFGHSCWGVAGTVCGGKVRGTFAAKEKECLACEVYKRYNRVSGRLRDQVAREYPEELAEFDRYVVKKVYGL